MIDRDVIAAGLRLQAWPEGWAGEATPTLSWHLESLRPGVHQIAYELEAANDADFSHGIATSGRIDCASPIGVAWVGTALASRQVRWVRVRIWTEHGETAWGVPLRVEAALLSNADWSARPVSPLSNVARGANSPVPMLRRRFHLESNAVAARLYVSVLGVHEAWINGIRVGDALLDPGWTEYRSRLLYAAYDVTALLQPGENVIASLVGDGWWRGRLTWMDREAIYGDTTALLAQLEIRTDQDADIVIGTDGTWKGAPSDILSADIYDGTTRDLRLQQTGWRTPSFDDSGWEGVILLPLPSHLELRAAQPVRIIERALVTPSRTDRGTYLIDAGQNLAGYIRVNVRGRSGDKVVVKHAEVLDANGRLFTAALRTAKATDSYVLAGSNAVNLEPVFTFHGFRYAEIECPQNVTLNSVEVVAVSSGLPQIGSFQCSDQRINKLFENIRWSQLGNFLAIPTDCPQRDERLGWTGDIQVFAQTACTNANAYAFLASWLKDLAVEQRPDGRVPSTVPNIIQGHEFEFAGVGWSDAAALVPWDLYKAYGSPEILARQFESMRGWVEYGLSRLDDAGVWTGDFHLGDWLDPGAPPDQPEKGTTDRDYIASAYLAHSTRTLSKAAGVLDKSELEHRYRDLGDRIAAATWARWHESARKTQTGCALAIVFGIAPPAELPTVADALAGHVAQNGGRIATGFLGTPLLLPALTIGGHIDAAYQLLFNESCPGWLYQIKQGATTTWERWDGILPDGRINAGALATNDAGMTSFNHYAYGAVGAWLYETVAGIASCEHGAGYRHISFAPRPGPGITWASAAVETPYGRAAIAWRVEANGHLSVTLDVPAGADATFAPPPEWTASLAGLYESGHHVILLHPAKRA